MTKRIISVAAIAAIALAACDKNGGGGTEYEEQTFSGTMEVTYEGTPYQTEGVIAVVSDFDEDSDKDIDITMKSVKFVPQMPVTVDVVIPDVPVTLSGNTLTISGDNIIPALANGTPYPTYTVTALSGAITGFGTSSATLSMSLNFGSFPTTYTGKTEKQ